MSGLAQACVRDKKLGSTVEISQFWIGFSRRYPLVDFVDVGSGKEEADNKLRGRWGQNIFGIYNLQEMLFRGSWFLREQSSVPAYLTRLLPRCRLRTSPAAICSPDIVI